MQYTDDVMGDHLVKSHDFNTKYKASPLIRARTGASCWSMPSHSCSYAVMILSTDSEMESVGRQEGASTSMSRQCVGAQGEGPSTLQGRGKGKGSGV